MSVLIWQEKQVLTLFIQLQKLGVLDKCVCTHTLSKNQNRSRQPTPTYCFIFDTVVLSLGSLMLRPFSVQLLTLQGHFSDCLECVAFKKKFFFVNCSLNHRKPFLLNCNIDWKMINRSPLQLSSTLCTIIYNSAVHQQVLSLSSSRYIWNCSKHFCL